MDFFLESRVRDLLATARQQIASQSYDAALASCRSALEAVDSALALDPGNQTAAQLREEILAIMPQPVAAPAVPIAPNSPTRAVKPPAFPLLREGHTPGEEFLASDHGGYLPEPEFVSILDSTPHPEKPDFLRPIAAISALVLLLVAGRVIWYYTHRPAVDSAPLEARAKYSATPPPQAVAQSSPEAADDTIYWAPSGIELPKLISKTAPPKGKTSGTVALLGVIDPAGRPQGLEVRAGLDADTNVLAMQTVAKWRYRPGSKDGKFFPTVAEFRVDFP